MEKSNKEKEEPKGYICPYSGLDCSEMNSLELKQNLDCKNCKNFDDGIRATGAIPDLSFLNHVGQFFNEVWEKK